MSNAFNDAAIVYVYAAFEVGVRVRSIKRNETTCNDERHAATLRKKFR